MIEMLRKTYKIPAGMICLAGLEGEPDTVEFTNGSSHSILVNLKTGVRIETFVDPSDESGHLYAETVSL